MTSDAYSDVARGRPVARTLLVLLIAFLAGLAAMAWILREWNGGARLLGLTEASARPTVVQPVIAPQTMLAPPAPEDIPGRLRLLEGRLAQIEESTRATAGNAGRADRLLVAFAARRALDRGVSLGYVEGLLRQRFAGTEPAAVATVIQASRYPVTLGQLQTELAKLQGVLETPPPQVGIFDRLRTELGSLVTVRKAGTPSTVPAERFGRARANLATGQVDVALAEVLRMPGSARAGRWVADARRYVAARRALDAIETSALLATPA